MTAWMRGSNNGDEADMTIDFRDQSMGGYDVAPVIAHTETKILTTSWAEYTMSATAPTTGDPIFGARTTFGAGQGSTVYIDDVRASLVPEPSGLLMLAAGVAFLATAGRRRVRR